MAHAHLTVADQTDGGRVPRERSRRESINDEHRQCSLAAVHDCSDSSTVRINSGKTCNNNSDNSNVYVAVIMTKVIARVHPVHLMNVD